MDTTWSKTKTAYRPGAKKCSACGYVFKPKEEFAVGETKTNWFRGDDMVEFFCRDCTPDYVKKIIKLK